MKFKSVSFLLCFLFGLTCASGATPQNNELSAKRKVESVFENQSLEEIDLQEKVFNSYYNELSETAKENVSFNAFKKYFLDNDLSINDCVDVINMYGGLDGSRGVSASTNTKWYQTNDDSFFMINDNHNRYGTNKSNYTPLPSYSSQEKSRTFDYNSSRDFTFDRVHGPSLPNYNAGISANYQYFLREGDIVWDCASFISADPANFVTHVGMIVNMNKDGVYWNSNGSANRFQFIETIEAYAGGVHFGYLDDNRILRFGTKVLRSTTATPEVVDSAIDFMFSQLGKEYNLDIFYSGSVPTRSRTNWYCTLLVFAAYYNAGVNICETWGSTNYYGYGGRISGPITGSMIYHAGTTEEIGFYTTNKDYPVLSVIGKSGSTWKISITNYSNRSYCVTYTPSMYFWGDIISTSTLLNDSLACVYLTPFESKTVNITENGLATTIAAYVMDGNEMVGTICNELSLPNKSLFACNLVETINDRVVYQLGKENDNSYQLQINNCFSSSKSFRLCGDSLKSESELANYNLKASTSEIPVTVSGRSAHYIRIASNSNSYYALREANSGSGTSEVINIVKFSLTKSNNKIAINKYSSDANFVRISIVSKSGSKWKIRIRNYSSSSRTVYYNTKMCNYGDAKAWTGLKNVTNVSVGANSYKDVDISENFFATSVTFKVELGGYKYITYADGLSTSGSLNYNSRKI